MHSLGWSGEKKNIIILLLLYTGVYGAEKKYLHLINLLELTLLSCNEQIYLKLWVWDTFPEFLKVEWEQYQI